MTSDKVRSATNDEKTVGPDLSKDGRQINVGITLDDEGNCFRVPQLVPPCEAILKQLGFTIAEFEVADSITVPASLIKLLLRIAVHGSSFNESGYLLANPDVAEAMTLAVIDSARAHYVEHGYFEGRKGALPAVDEAWYLREYPDVAKAVAKAEVRSAVHHFREAGCLEFRSPSAEFRMDAAEWERALRDTP